MSGVHWRAGKFVFPSPDGSGFESKCFASIDDAADYANTDIARWVHTAYEEWDLGIDGADTLRYAAAHMVEAEVAFGDLTDDTEDTQQWLREGREARVGDTFVAACSGKPGPCTVHPPEKE